MPVRLKKILIVLCVVCSSMQTVLAQSWNTQWFFTGGVNLMLHKGKGQNFPGIRFNASAGVNSVYNNYFICNYALTLSLYAKTVGANLNPLVNDVQFDVVNSVSLGGCWGETLRFNKYFRTFNNGAYYNFSTQQANSVMLGSHFILNQHYRNQLVGHVTVSTQWATLNYYNDGAPPISWLSLGDEFDRWWTGGLGVFIHTQDGYNLVEVMFDQFTGYKPQLYEISNVLGIDVPDYGNNKYRRRKKVPPDFNTSAYTVRYFFAPGISAEAGIIGRLRCKNGRAFGLQDIIHILQGHALHPNHDINRFFIGGNYIYTNDN
jgi:hypothetical protein